MILDDLLALFVGLFEAVVNFFCAMVDLVFTGAEAVLGIFIVGISLPRISREESETEGSPAGPPARGTWLTGAVIIIALVLLLLVPLAVNRKVSFVAADGHGLPYAEVVIHKGGTQIHKRTDSAGNLKIPRFGVTALTIKSPRYVEQTWKGEEIQSRLIVRRTVLGSGLDKVARTLLRPEREQKPDDKTSSEP